MHAANNHLPAFPGSGTGMLAPGMVKDDSQASYSYAPKSRLIYQRGGKNSETRSRTSSRVLAPIGYAKKTPSQVSAYTAADQGDEVRSRLSKASIQRFNEQLPELGPNSQKSGVSLNAKSLKSGFSERPSIRTKQSIAASFKSKGSRLDAASLKAISIARQSIGCQGPR